MSLSVSNEAVLRKYQERLSAVVHENLVLTAVVEELQTQNADKDAQIAQLLAAAEPTTGPGSG